MFDGEGKTEGCVSTLDFIDSFYQFGYHKVAEYLALPFTVQAGDSRITSVTGNDCFTQVVSAFTLLFACLCALPM